jgi:WD40 repeat protein
MPGLLVAIALLGALAAPSAPAGTVAVTQPAGGPDALGQPSRPFEQVGELKGAQVDVIEHQGIVFTPDGRLFLAEDPHATSVRLWDLRTLKPITEPLKHPDVIGFSVTADGKTVFTSGCGEVRLWDVATSKRRATVKADTEDLSVFDATGDGRRFLTVPHGGETLTVWNATGERPTKAYDVRGFKSLNSAHFDPTGRYIVDKEFIGPFGLLRADTGRAVCPPFDAHGTTSKGAYLAQFEPAGRRLAIPMEGGFRLVDCASGKTVATAHWGRDLEADQISFSPDGSLVAMEPWDRDARTHGPVLVFDAATARLVDQINFVDVVHCQLNPGGRFLLCHHGDHADPELIDLHNGATVQTFPSTRDANGMAVMSPDGETILVGLRPDTIAVWRLRHAGPATQP